MNPDKVKQLLEKYWEGQSSLEEESIIKSYFSSGQVDAEFQKYLPYFSGIEEKKKDTFNLSLNDLIDAGGTNSRPTSKVIRMQWLRQVAAVMILGIVVSGVFLVTQTKDNSPVATENLSTEGQTQAYHDTKNALLLVSKKLNAGTQHLRQIGKIDETKKNISKQ